jgi:hypothetical protein
MKTEEISEAIELIFKNTERIHGNSDGLDWIKIASIRSAKYLEKQIEQPFTCPVFDCHIKGQHTHETTLSPYEGRTVLRPDSPLISDEEIEKQYPFYVPEDQQRINILRREGAKWHRSQSQVLLRAKRFTKPTDRDLVGIALLFNNGKIQKSKLRDMVAMAEFIIDRLYENGNTLTPSSKENT